MDTLELGGGSSPKYHPNIDIRGLPTADVVHDLSKGIPFPSESFDLVYSRHFLEHIPRHKVQFLVKEMSRVLRPKGRVVILVPDLEGILRFYQRVGVNEQLQGSLMGGQSHEHDYHKSIFDRRLLTRILERAGFKVLRCEQRIAAKTGRIELEMEAVKHGEEK